MENENVFKRFVAIFKPDFLLRNFNELNSAKTWKFWFFWNTVLALVFAGVMYFAFAKGVQQAENYLNSNYPDAKVSITGGKLSIDGVPQPIMKNTDSKSVVVIDTKGEQYDETVLNDYESGVFVSATKVVNKKNPVESQTFNISEVKKDFSFTEKDLAKFKGAFVSMMMGLFLLVILIYFNFIRLIAALWWALIFWLLGKLMKVKDMTFERTYFAVLNFYIIPTLITLVFIPLEISIPFLTFLIFLVLFIMNYVKINKNAAPEIPEAPQNQPPQDTTGLPDKLNI